MTCDNQIAHSTTAQLYDDDDDDDDDDDKDHHQNHCQHPDHHHRHVADHSAAAEFNPGDDRVDWQSI